MNKSIHDILASKTLDNHAIIPLDLKSITKAEVQKHLNDHPGRFSMERLAAFVSPAAEDYLEQMAARARDLTIQRFGRTIQLYAPLYVSNYCINSCRYCGFNKTHKFNRIRLSIEQALADADVIASEGFRHILLVSGEDPWGTPVEYFCDLASRLRRKFSSISAEIYPLSTEDYRKLFNAGIDGITLYQETYDRHTYAAYHTAGPKSDYDYRLESPDRYASASMRRIGLGFLLGLADWRIETLAMGQHAVYLMKKYWRGQVSFSFPRIRPAFEVAQEFPHLVSDVNMVQMMLALRLCFADAGIVLSTRESQNFRNNLIKICVTRLSAGSKTNPGGYSGGDTTEQFTIDDNRTPAEMAEVIRSAGYEAVWKDWDRAFTE